MANKSTQAQATNASSTVKPESKSAMIRRLHFVENKSVNEIHKATGIRYQMVRNIVVAEINKQALAKIANK